MLEPVFCLEVKEKYIEYASKLDIPSFCWSSNGELLMVWHDTVLKALASSDSGRTWHPWTSIQSWPQVSLMGILRVGDNLLLVGNDDSHPWKEGTPQVWLSPDEGRTWKGGQPMTGDTGGWAIMNDRLLLTSKGRIIAPIDHLLGREGPDPDQAGTMVSDDGGNTWQYDRMFGPPAPLPVRPEGFGEPAVVELADGTFWMVFRSLFGHLWQALSEDGLHWGPPSPTGLASPLSAMNAKRIPGSDSVVLVWNHVKPGLSSSFSECPSIYRPRAPLVFSVSHDRIRSWSCPTIIYKGTGIYPSIAFSDSEMFITYKSNPDLFVCAGADYGVRFAVYETRDVLAQEPWNEDTIKPYIADGRVAPWLIRDALPAVPQSGSVR